MSLEARAESSFEYAQMARATWSAFECSSLAGKLKKADAETRLFEFGYKNGLAFIDAVKNGKIKQEDLSKSAPIGVLWLLQGPTPDFMLGRIYESAQNEVLKDVYRVGEHFNLETEQELIASKKFTASNCELIGLTRTHRP